MTTTGIPDVKKAIFFEQQNGMLCAQHALNMLLQGPYFSAVSLAEVASALDEQEKAVLDPEQRANFRSQNMDDSGFFSIQVITSALEQSWNIGLTPYNHPTVAEYTHNPERAKAYICNLSEHWFTIRKFHEQWYILNSLKDGPEEITDSYLSLYLRQLITEGYHIFLVTGFLPECQADDLAREKAELQESLQASIDPTPSAPSLEEDEQMQIEMAIAMSLDEATGGVVSNEQNDLNQKQSQEDLDECADLQRALRESLLESESNQPSSSKDVPSQPLSSEPSVSTTTKPEKKWRTSSFKFSVGGRMSILSSLVADEAPPSVASTDTISSNPPSLNNGHPSDLDNLLNDQSFQLKPSALGDAINNVLVQWNQLLSHMVGDVGHTQPASDHVKELAEYSVRQMRETCMELTSEFHRTALEWRMMHPEEALKEDIADYREAVTRQNQLLTQVEEALQSALDRYKQHTRTNS
ncbi:Ubiquitinyl hydrolase 1 [Aphelenchoides besseyi]|nr:Ubiquitinyl hydrolase 1 [Aphelenchoides besseyi]